MNHRITLCLLVAAFACGGGEEADTTPVEEESTSGTETAAVSPIPEGMHNVVPHLVVEDIDAAIAWYERALGAQRRFVLNGPDGSPMHGEIQLGDSVVMIGAEEADHGIRAPSSLGGTSGGLMVYVEDVDATHAAAVEAGATASMPVGDMFWGDRYGAVTDPFGHRWSLATHRFDSPRDQMAARAAAFGQAMAAGEPPPSYPDDPPASHWQPEGMFTVTPSLVVSGPADLDLYVAAFGAEEISRTLTPAGTLMHGELRIGDSIVMLSQADPRMEPNLKTPAELGGVPFDVMVYVEDVDAAHARAVEAGAAAVFPPTDMFWGDRWGSVRDASGHVWGIATHIADPTPEEMQQRMMEQFPPANR